MSDHRAVLVPLATGNHASPVLFERGIAADTGLFAEALLYYDEVTVTVDNGIQFAAFISRLIQQGLSYEHLIALVEDGSLRFLKTVTTHPFCVNDAITGQPRSDIITQFISIQESAIYEPNYFDKIALDTEQLRDAFSDLAGLKQGLYDRFCEAASKSSTILNGEEVGDGVVYNAYDDFLNPTRCKVIVVGLLEKIYESQGLGAIPDFEIRIQKLDTHNLEPIARNLNSTVIYRQFDDESPRIYEVDIDLPTTGLDDEVKFRRIFHTLPLSVAGVSNLLIRSAAEMRCDFFLPEPLSQIVGDKLYEIDAVQSGLKRQNIVNSLGSVVNFPDIQYLVNRNDIDFLTVLNIRKKGKRFRDWLQSTEGGEDWKVFHAYHNEVAKEAGFIKGVRKNLKVFGVFASAAAGVGAGIAAKAFTDDPRTHLVAGSAAAIISEKLLEKAASELPKKLFEYGANFGEDWRPKCFGDWMGTKIKKALTENK